jgi:hypothetical protein
LGRLSPFWRRSAEHYPQLADHSLELAHRIVDRLAAGGDELAVK